MTDLDKAYEINKTGLHIVEETDTAYHLANYDKSMFVWLNKEPEAEFLTSLYIFKDSFLMATRRLVKQINAKEITIAESIKDIDMGSM